MVSVQTAEFFERIEQVSERSVEQVERVAERLVGRVGQVAERSVEQAERVAERSVGRVVVEQQGVGIFAALSSV